MGKLPDFLGWAGKDVVLTIGFGIVSTTSFIFSLMALEHQNKWYCKNAVSYSTLESCDNACPNDNSHRCGTWSDPLGTAVIITSLCISIFGMLVVFVLIMGWKSITRLLCLVTDEGSAHGEFIGLVCTLFPFATYVVRLAFFDGFYGKEKIHVTLAVLHAIWLIIGFGFCLVIHDKLTGKKKKKKRRHRHEEGEQDEENAVYRDPEDVYY